MRAFIKLCLTVSTKRNLDTFYLLLVLSQAWDKENILVPIEESNPGPLKCGLLSSTTELKEPGDELNKDNTAVKSNACTRILVNSGRLGITFLCKIFEEKRKKQLLSCKVSDKKLKWKFVKRNKCKEKENFRFFKCKAYLITGVLLIFHSVLSFTRKVIHF